MWNVFLSASISLVISGMAKLAKSFEGFSFFMIVNLFVAYSVNRIFGSVLTLFSGKNCNTNLLSNEEVYKRNRTGFKLKNTEF